jgi:hypothetical protein
VFDGLQLYDDQFIDEQVRSKTHIEAQFLVSYGDGHLTLHTKAASLKLMR